MSYYTETIVLNQTDAGARKGAERGKSKGRGASARPSALE